MRVPMTWTMTRHDGPNHLGFVMRCAARAPNGPDHLGFVMRCAPRRRTLRGPCSGRGRSRARPSAHRSTTLVFTCMIVPCPESCRVWQLVCGSWRPINLVAGRERLWRMGTKEMMQPCLIYLHTISLVGAVPHLVAGREHLGVCRPDPSGADDANCAIRFAAAQHRAVACGQLGPQPAMAGHNPHCVGKNATGGSSHCVGKSATSGSSHCVGKNATSGSSHCVGKNATSGRRHFTRGGRRRVQTSGEKSRPPVGR